MNDAPELHARPKIIGARIKRTEDPRLLTGLGAYTDDRQVMRVLHVAFRRSDQAHARIRAIDCSPARSAPGIVAVLTADDLSTAVRPLVAGVPHAAALLGDLDELGGRHQIGQGTRSIARREVLLGRIDEWQIFCRARLEIGVGVLHG